MKYVDGVLEFDRVHRSIGISAMVLDYFEDPWSFPSPRFRAWVLATKLRNAESGSNFIDHRLRESQQVILAGSGPEQWLLAGDALRSRHVSIPVLGYHVKRARHSLESYTVTANSLPRFKKISRTRVYKGCLSTSTKCAFFVPVLIETIQTWASFIDSDSLMTRATCNCGRVRREHFGKWPPGRQESCGSRSTAGKKTVFLRPKSR